jgi:hypothetical protein
MEVKFLASVKFVCKKEFNIKVYLMYSGFKERCYGMIY